MPGNDRDEDATGREGRLDGVLADYLEAVESGSEPDRRALLVRHPEFYDELTDFFADGAAIETITRPLLEASRDLEEESALGPLDPSEVPGHLGRLGPYEVVDWLGQGGMGVVFKGFDPSLNRYAAIKVLAPQWSADPGARRRFTREARSAAAISHPHVVTIHAVGEWKGRPYLVMEYVPGPTLQERLDEAGPPRIAEAVAIAMQVASGLAAAHAQGLIHRDIKPANILLEGDLPRAKLGDFGLARAVDDASLTRQGALAGTPQYMAPEQARGEHLDCRADLFSLGGVLHALCTGEPPFRGGSTPEVLRRVCDEEPPSSRRINREVPDWLAEIIARLMAKDRANRFDTAAEVADLLGRHLARLRDPSLPPAGRARATPRRRLRRRAVAVASTLLAGPLSWAFAYLSLLPPPSANDPARRLRGPIEVETALPMPPGEARPSPSHPRPGRLVGSFLRDFRGPDPDLRGLTFLVKPGLDALPRPDRGGLRMTVPRGLVEGVGVATTFRVGGDFEITLDFEVLPTDDLPEGPGPGLTISPVGERDAFASIGRVRRGEAAVDSLSLGTVAADGRRRVIGRWPGAGPRSGRFRLIRVGPKLRYLVADGEGGEFLERFRANFGPAEVESVRIGIDMGGSSGGAEVLLKSLEIRAESLPGWPPPGP